MQRLLLVGLMMVELFTDIPSVQAADVTTLCCEYLVNPMGIGSDTRLHYLRKTLKLADKPVTKARLYITALGLYEVNLNGKRIGDSVFAPDWTDYGKRVRYQVYDVTPMLRKSDNVLAGLVGPGWFSGHTWLGVNHYGKVQALLAQMEVIYADGTGFKKLLIRPTPPALSKVEGGAGIDWVKASYDSINGKIATSWKTEANTCSLDVTIPPNTTASVYVPTKDAAGVTGSGKPATKAKGVKFLRLEAGAAMYAVGSGTYRFESTLPGTVK